MYRRIRLILKTIIAASVGCFIGKAAYVCWHYAKHAGQYAAQSAPWYTSILVSALVAACIILAVLVTYIVLGILERNYIRRKEGSNGNA